MPAPRLIIGVLLVSGIWVTNEVRPAELTFWVGDGAQANPDAVQQHADKKSSQATEPVDRALEIVAYAATLVPSFPRVESQVAAYVALGDTLWRYDQARAREYFTSAFVALEKVDVTTKPKDRQEAKAQQRLKHWKDQTRTQLLNHIARLDVDLARELASRFGEKEVKSSSGDEAALNAESVGLTFQRAYELLDTDPEQAAALAQQTLAAGVSPWLIEFLPALRQRAPALADQLFAAALEVILSQSNPPDVSLLHLLGPYILQATVPVDPALTRRFLALMAYGLQAQADATASGVRRLSPAEQFYLTQLYLPVFERYTPELVPMVQTLLDRLSANLPPEQRPAGPGPPQNRPGSGLGPGSGQEPRISSGNVGGAGNFTSAEPAEGGASAAEGFIMKIQDEKLRQALLDMRRYNSAWQALEQGKVDEAYGTAQQIKDPLKQIDLFVELGKKLGDRGETDRAIMFFDKASQLISTLSDLREGTTQALQLARSALEVNRDRALYYAQGAVTLLNRLQSRERAETDLMSELAGRQMVRGQLEAIFVPLGRADFEQAIYLAVQLQDAEQRVIAEIAACRSALEQARKKTTEPNPLSPTESSGELRSEPRGAKRSVVLSVPSIKAFR